MLRVDINDLDKNGQKGDWCFTNNDQYLFLRYGETLDDTCMVNVGDATRMIWQWDGSKESPTISPSIRCFTGETTLWHGYLRKGKLEEA